ncbi:MAG: hypothetical protein EXR92_03230 [Gemmatimonadetes bacterium]|nr:hypothetical protein [Gemmatimonadota bacterium]
MSDRSLKWQLVLRSLLIQGSWNYRTLLGAGVGWALLPVLRKRRGAEPPSAWIARQTAHFNAHPYLTPLALGALARAETGGAEPERVQRFRDALRGPLGSLGDGFVWGSWRPLCILTALLAGVLGAPPSAVVIGFIVVYNVAHLAIRGWGVGLGLEMGFTVAEGIRRMDLPGWAERTAKMGVLILGVASGVALGLGLGFSPPRILFLGAASASFVIGFLGGESLQRWGPILLLGIVLTAFAAGAGPWLVAPE